MSASEKKINELVIISGKGGTGKTSVTASFAVLSDGQAVLADCDVDAADLHLVLETETVTTEPFISGHEAIIQREKCTGCGKCAELCIFDAPKYVKRPFGKAVYTIDAIACEGCGVCVRFCPEEAISFPDRVCGEWMVSKTRCGTMVHARLSAAAENSGKLVAMVRQEAERLAEAQNKPLIITDGPPGIGCPVIASLTGASYVLMVSEPTVSGEHDLERVLRLAAHFEIPCALCVNKWDINPELTERMERLAERHGATSVGRIRYDRAVTTAQLRKQAVVELDAPAGEDIRKVWECIAKTFALPHK